MDARVEIVAATLREHGHNATGSGADTDTLATAIVNALDAGTAAFVETEGGTDDQLDDTAHDTETANPETPKGTGREGGSRRSAQ